MNEQQEHAIDAMIAALTDLASELKALKFETDEVERAARFRQINMKYRQAQAAWNDGWREAFGGRHP
jgi:hypothetical protein